MIDPRLRVLYLGLVAVGALVVKDVRILVGLALAHAIAWLLLREGARALARQLFKLSAFAGFIVLSYALTKDDPATDRWSQGSRSPRGEVLDALTVAIGDRVYVFGGRDDRETVNEAQTYDPATDQWGPLPSSPTSSGSYNATVAGGKIYLMGPSAVAFDPSTGVWSTLPPLQRPRISPGVAADPGGHVLVFGGFDGDGSVALVESFDPAKGAWGERALMPRPTFLFGVAPACGGSRVFVFGGDAGGFTATPMVQIYGPGDVWTRSL